MLATIRGKALDSVQKALQLDSGTKAILQFVWNLNLSKVSEEENDLEVFYSDPDFQKLLM